LDGRLSLVFCSEQKADCRVGAISEGAPERKEFLGFEKHARLSRECFGKSSATENAEARTSSSSILKKLLPEKRKCPFIQ